MRIVRGEHSKPVGGQGRTLSVENTRIAETIDDGASQEGDRPTKPVKICVEEMVSISEPNHRREGPWQGGHHIALPYRRDDDRPACARMDRRDGVPCRSIARQQGAFGHRTPCDNRRWTFCHHNRAWEEANGDDVRHHDEATLNAHGGNDRP